MATWQCVKKCGACCNLTPAERPELEEYLTPEQLETYTAMVGPDGWCVHYDRQERLCQIYDRRPSFCRVQADTFYQMFGVEEDELNDFAIDCCQQQIIGVYGRGSEEMERFSAAVGLDQ